MNYIITGSSGFIGSSLCKKLIKDNNFVIGIDSKFPSINNLNYTHIDYDISSSSILDINFESIFIPDIIYNLASPTIPKDCIDSPEKTFKTNTIGTINILEIAKKYNIPLIQVSTIRVFEPITESNKKLECYINGKKESESICNRYITNYNMDIRIARLFSVYGKMSINDSRVIPVFIKKALKDENIEIWGTGEQQDSFTYIDDIIDDLINLEDPIVELGGDIWISIKDLANKIISLANSNSKVILIDKPGTADRKTMQKNYKSRTSLDDGLLKTIEYYRDLVQRSSC